MSDDDKSPVEQLLDMFVYAPIGLFFEGRSVLTELAEKGRNQASMARVIGQFAVQQGQVEATKAAGRLQEQAVELLGAVTRPSRPASPARESALPSAASPSSFTVPERVAPAVDAPAVDELAIPDYDGLSASQVVNRLAGLSVHELSAVRAYEAANRARKTVLNKATQLLGG